MLINSGAPLLMPSELTGCLCLLPSTSGFRTASLMELAHHMDMWSEPELSTVFPQITPSVRSMRRRRAGSQESLQDSDWLWQVYQLWLSAGSARPRLKINWDACALHLRDNCITEIYLLLKVSPPLSLIRKMRSYSASQNLQ